MYEHLKNDLYKCHFQTCELTLFEQRRLTRHWSTHLRDKKNTQSVSWLTKKFPFYIKQGSYSFEPFKFHDFPLLFPWPFPVFHDFSYSCYLRKFSKLSLFLFRVFTLLSATNNTLVSTICAISKSRLILSFCPYFGVCTN